MFAKSAKEVEHMRKQEEDGGKKEEQKRGEIRGSCVRGRGETKKNRKKENRGSAKGRNNNIRI